MKSVITYYGGKSELAKDIAPYVPAGIKRYVEPFFGSGGLFFYRETRWASIEIINDLNGDVVNFFKVLRDKPKKLIDLLQMTPHSRQEQREAAGVMEKSKNDVTRALYFFIRINQSFNGVRGWSIPVDKNRSREWSNKCNPDILYKAAARLKLASIENSPALKVMKLYDRADTFLYLDPPYLSVNDPEGKRTGYRGYDMVEEDHEIFIDQCLKMKSQTIISGYEHSHYNRLTAAGWRKVKILTEAKSTNHKNIQIKNARIEILWISPNIKPAQNTLF